jgi:hypothetical protein
MTTQPEFMAKSLVRSYSNSLKSSESMTRNISPPRMMIERALNEEVDREDEFAELLRVAASR